MRSLAMDKMMHRIIVILRLDNDPPIDHAVWHGWAYQMLRHPLTQVLWEKYHNELKKPPFRLLIERGRSRRVVTITLTLLDLGFLPALSVEFQPGRRSYLGDARATVESVAWSPQDDPQAGLVSLEEMLGRVQPASSYKLRFVSPTTFTQKDGDGRRWFSALPTVDLVLRSLERQWSQWFGQVPTLWAGAACEVKPGQFSIRSQTVKVGGYTIPGFVGSMELVLGDVAPREQRALATLLAIGPYSGVGAKVAYGLGQLDVASVKVAAKGRAALAQAKPVPLLHSGEMTSPELSGSTHA